MATNQHETQGGRDSILSRLKGVIGALFEPPSYSQPAYSIKSVTCENDVVYKVGVSLTYACATPSMINTFTRGDDLIYVQNDGKLEFIPQRKSHHNLNERVIEEGREHIYDMYEIETEN